MSAAAALLLALAAQPARASRAPDTLAIERATVIPMDRDTALADHTVLVAGERVVWVGPSRAARVPPNARRVDGRGRYLIPGLADMHVHLGADADLPRYVAAGVTTVLHMNGRPELLAMRRRVAEGAVVGPRVFTAGPAVRRRWGGLRGVGPRTVAEADSFVRAQRRAGYDVIKVQTGIDLPVYRRLVAVARSLGMPVMGHVVSGIGAERSLAIGQVSLEHAGPPLFDGGESRMDEGARAIARAGATVGTIVSARDGRCAPPTALQRRIVGALRRARVTLLAGSDAGIGPVPHGEGLHCELRTLASAGLTPYEALGAAARDAGDFARRHLGERVPFGTVTVGARADLVLLPADPRADLGALSRPLGTVLRGVWRPRAAAGAVQRP